MIEMFLKWISYIFGFVGCGGLSFSTFFSSDLCRPTLSRLLLQFKTQLVSPKQFI